MKTTPIALSWSGGKDSAMALYELGRNGCYEVVSLLTTISAEYRRISHHGVREELLDDQSEALGIALEKIYLPTTTGSGCTDDVYEAIMSDAMQRYKTRGIHTVAFGDLFLEDLRQWREAHLARAQMRGLFPLWQRDTSELAREFIKLGFKACLSCVEPRAGGHFAGREFDEMLLAELPADIDPCGENGEFHSFVYDGPIFRRAVPVRIGEIVSRDTRHYADLLFLNEQPAKSCTAEDIPPVRTLQ